jgi:hypothetical protein
MSLIEVICNGCDVPMYKHPEAFEVTLKLFQHWARDCKIQVPKVLINPQNTQLSQGVQIYGEGM